MGTCQSISHLQHLRYLPWFHRRISTFKLWSSNTRFSFHPLCTKQKVKPFISYLMWKASNRSAAMHKYLALLYSLTAGIKVITMQCLAASLIGAHCEIACTNPGDKYPQAVLLLVALWIFSWWWSHFPALYSCSPADRAPQWKLILETLLRFKIKTQRFAVQNHWETSFDLMVICYIHFNSTDSLNWWTLFCQQKGRHQ